MAAACRGRRGLASGQASARYFPRFGIGNNGSRSQSEASMIAPLALAIGATAPVLPAAADLEVSVSFARTAVANQLAATTRKSRAPATTARRGARQPDRHVLSPRRKVLLSRPPLSTSTTGSLAHWGNWARISYFTSVVSISIILVQHFADRSGSWRSPAMSIATIRPPRCGRTPSPDARTGCDRCRRFAR
jgi:hypothetical protein